MRSGPLSGALSALLLSAAAAQSASAPAWDPRASVEYLLKHQKADGTWINLDVVLETTEDGKRNGMRDNTDPGRRIYSTAMALMAFARLPGE